jgi:hypothetical protein
MKSQIKLETIALPLLLVGGSLFGYCAYKIDEEKIMYSEIIRRADMNHDKIVDENEWREVYERLGINYDFKNMQKLTKEQMQKYLKINS